MNASRMTYKSSTFATKMIPILDEITCESGEAGRGGVSTYVLQTGSWDLQFFPIRGFINSPYQGRGVVDAVTRMWERVRGVCEDRVRIVWVSTMLHPWCAETDRHCLKLANYWRNNGAVNAGNQFMEEALKQVWLASLVLLATVTGVRFSMTSMTVRHVMISMTVYTMI